MVGLKGEGDLIVPLFFYFLLSFTARLSEPFPPTTPQPYQIIGKSYMRVVTHNSWYLGLFFWYERTSSA